MYLVLCLCVTCRGVKERGFLLIRMLMEKGLFLKAIDLFSQWVWGCMGRGFKAPAPSLPHYTSSNPKLGIYVLGGCKS